MATGPRRLDALIIGSGPAGSTAALYLARAGYHPVVLHGSSPGGQLTTTTDIENFPGWTGTGPDLVRRMEEQATAAGATYVYEEVVTADILACPKRIVTDAGTTFLPRVVIIATGAIAVYLGIESETRLKGRGVSGCATCDGPLYRGADVVVVGGGDSAIEEALFLSNICKSVKLVHRRNELRASEPMKKKFQSSTVVPIWNSVVTECIGDDVLTAVKLQNIKTLEETVVQCAGLFVAIGRSPATTIFRSQLECFPDGTIATHGSPQTSVDGVFACGDCADRVYRQAITSAATGCQAALLAEKYLRDARP